MSLISFMCFSRLSPCLFLRIEYQKRSVMISRYNSIQLKLLVPPSSIQRKPASPPPRITSLAQAFSKPKYRRIFASISSPGGIPCFSEVRLETAPRECPKFHEAQSFRSINTPPYFQSQRGKVATSWASDPALNSTSPLAVNSSYRGDNVDQY